MTVFHMKCCGLFSPAFYSWCEQKAEIDSVVAGQFWSGSFHPNTDGLDASNYDGGACITLEMNPTHWMPLPEPPKDGE